MKQVLIRQGQTVVEKVPAPLVEPGTVLVRVDHSCISIGTEMVGVRTTGLPLWKRALKQPENVKKVFEMAATHGAASTRRLVGGILSAGSPSGYSAAGVVLEVGEGIDDLRPRDRVACCGGQCAYHAEIIRVPRNFVAPVPDNVNFAAASTVSLGAIALQAVRRAQPTLGEIFVVIGLGVLGQLTAQILRANGCRVIGTDLDPERIRLAEQLGMETGIDPAAESGIEHVGRVTGGIGADGVIITAATPSHTVISTAFQMCRKKGRVVLVGDVGLNLDRTDFYEKELDLFVSTSYGPGRYDNSYEERGLDYPVAYVRWTENRNMVEYLRLLADGKVQIAPLVTASYPVDQAGSAFETLKNKEASPLMLLLSYPQSGEDDSLNRVVANPTAQPAGPGQIRIAVVGAGDFAKSTHLPNLQSLAASYHIQAVVSRTGHNANNVARQFGAQYAATDYQAVLSDAEIDAVLIATRHNLHASMVLRALDAGKHVLVEKPLALTPEELGKIRAFYDSDSYHESLPILLTGFNRRFSSFIQRINELTQGRSSPMILNYRMNATYIPLDHWVHTEEGGGRNLGEACHIYDLFTYLTDSNVLEVSARGITPKTGYYSPLDNFVATMTFEDGSVATLTYTALGAKDYPKESLEVYTDGKVLVLEDYRSLTIYGAKVKGLKRKLMDKGHKEALRALARAIQEGGDWPIPLWQQVQATEMALQVEEHLRQNHGRDLDSGF
jgi:predicted dehydrogenase/threonine dehydrogenase-like Zn-dependent dehydrogenase